MKTIQLTLRLPEPIHRRSKRVSDERGMSLTAFIAMSLDQACRDYAKMKQDLSTWEKTAWLKEQQAIRLRKLDDEREEAEHQERIRRARVD